MRGRKPLPNEVKQARGETRPSRTNEDVVEFPIVAEVPKPPAWLKLKAGKDLWNEVAPTFYAQRILTTADVYALGHMCQLHAEIVDCVRKKVGVSAADRSQLRMYFSEFGMTPSSRQRIGAPSAGGKDNNRFKRNGSGPPSAD